MNNESDQPVYMAVKVDYLDDKGNLMSAEEFKKYASITDYDNETGKWRQSIQTEVKCGYI